MTGTVLVLGSSGNFGRRAAEAFGAAGWQVRRYARGTDMALAAQGVDVIVNALNPPMYHDWARLVPEITGAVIGAARQTGATVLVPGNVYVYGDQPGPWGPQTPHRPVSRKGAIRAGMEAAYRDSGLRTILLRGGDFVDPVGPHTILRMVVLKGLAKGRITTAGPVDVARAWAWLPDMARAGVELAARRDDLPVFADVPYAGLTFSVADLQAGYERLMGRRITVSRFPWWALRLAAPVWELGREMLEMRYLYETPHALDPAPMAALLPGFRGVSFETVLRAHLPAGMAVPALTAAA